MFQPQKILAARDFSDCSEHALSYALMLARRFDAELHMLFAEVQVGELVDAEGPATRGNKVRERLKHIPEPEGGDALAPGAFHIQPVVVRDMAPAPAILTYAREQAIDLIVMGTHGRQGLRHLLLGSVAEEVVRLSSCPVLTVAQTVQVQPVEGAVSTILVPIDFSRYAREALSYATELAALFGARLDLLHVVDSHVYPGFIDTGLIYARDVKPAVEEQTRARLARFYHSVAGPGGGAVHLDVRAGSAPYEILRYAEQNASGMIVMATHGLTGLRHFLIGSVAEKVIRTAPCPVFTIKSVSQASVHEVEAARATSVG